MAIRLNIPPDSPFSFESFRKRAELEALELDLRLREARIKTAELAEREAKVRARMKRMEAKASEAHKCAEVMRERRAVCEKATPPTPFPDREAMLDEIKAKHPDLAKLTVRSRAFESAWKEHAPDDAKLPGKKPRS